MFNLYLNNYRCFDKQEFKFSKINIIIGENSSGKSSVLKFLLMLKQTLVSPTKLNWNLNLKEKYGDVDFGSYYEIISNHDVNKKLEFGFEFEKSYHDYYLDFMTSHNKTSSAKNSERKKLQNRITVIPNTKTFVKYQLSKKLNDHTAIKTVISNPILGQVILKPIQNALDVEPGLYPTCEVSYKRLRSKENIVLKNVEYSKHGFTTLIQGGSLLARCKSELHDDMADLIFEEIAYLLVTQNFVETNLVNFIYVNPVDSSPERIYLDSPDFGLHPVSDIEDVISILTDDTLTEKVRSALLERLNSLLSQMGIAKEIKILKEKNSVAMELRVRVSDNDVWSNIKDVGYGVPLQIPILFQAILSDSYLKRRQAIFIEQPETHLYPKLQANFIDTLLSIGDNNAYFIETHSEHIIRKLQILVKNRQYKLKPEDVSILYFKKNTDKSEIIQHILNDKGRLTPPLSSDFFDTSYNLIKDLMF